MHGVTDLPKNRDRYIECVASPGFAQWLAELGGSLAITTYQAGKLVVISASPPQIMVLMRDFLKPMGLSVEEDMLAIATQHELLQFANAASLAPEYLEGPARYDSLWIPRVAHFTGDLNVHDISYGAKGPWMVNTRFSCIARPSAHFNFEPVWRPPFISDVVPEDRCHLNGLAMKDGEPRFVTAFAETDSPGGWREWKLSGGVLIDVKTDEVITRGLAMPHSPRYYANQVWLLNSALGELWRINPNTGAHAVVCRLPAYARGLDIAGDHAIVGLSRARERGIFGLLPVHDPGRPPICGVAIIELPTGNTVGTFEFTSGVDEVYDVRFLPHTIRPNVLNVEKQATREAVTMPNASYWLRPAAEAPLVE